MNKDKALRIVAVRLVKCAKNLGKRITIKQALAALKANPEISKLYGKE